MATKRRGTRGKCINIIFILCTEKMSNLPESHTEITLLGYSANSTEVVWLGCLAVCLTGWVVRRPRT